MLMPPKSVKAFTAFLGTTHCNGAAVRVQVVGDSQSLLQFDIAEVILHFDLLADSDLHQGHCSTVCLDTK